MKNAYYTQLLLLILLFFLASHTNAQTTVIGTVTAAQTNTPLANASVVVKGGTQGTATDDSGNFSLKVPQSATTLIVSLVGYQSKEVTITNTRILITLDIDRQKSTLDQVVVVGYATQKKATLTGAIASISGKDILTTKAPSLAASLAGKVPGLQIRQNSGMPGLFSTNINIRGMGQPLFVIDGVVRNDGTEFQKLNPEDIESISVLKDASAAIYGINASNGAILVKTKLGSKGPLRLSYNAFTGISKPTGHIPMMDASQYWEIRNENEYYSTGIPYFSTNQALDQAKAQPTTNWYNTVFKKAAIQQQHNLILQGGNDQVATYMNIGLQTDNGLLKSGDIAYQKVSFRNGTTVNAGKNIKVEFSLAGYKDFRKQPGTQDDAFYYINKATYGLIPSETIFANNNEAYYNRPDPLTDNPVLMAQSSKYGYDQWREALVQSMLSITYSVPQLKGLKLKLQGAYDYKNTYRTRVQKRTSVYKYSPSTSSYTQYFTAMDPAIQEENINSGRANLQAQLIYNKKIAGAHDVDIVLVSEAREDKGRYLSAKRFYEQDLYTTDNIDRAPTNNQQTGGWTNRNTYLSLIGRLNYAYKSKYLLEFDFREDGSYRYAPAKRWGFFPVTSVGWRLSEERFIKNNLPLIYNLKLRASYGTTAQDAGDPFQFISGFQNYNGYVMDGSGKFVSGFASGPLLNSNLSWTTSNTSNIGIDISLWKQQLEFTFEVYRRDRNGLLTTRVQALPNTFGATLPQENLNSDRTEGFELMIGHKNTIQDFQYGISANMNIGRTKVIYQERADFTSSMDKWRNGQTGRWQDIGWGYQTAGQYQDFEQIRSSVMETTTYGNAKTLPGDYIHADVNGDGVINSGDMLPLFWNGQPKLTCGLSAYCNWKGIDFNMVWQGAGLYSVKYNEILGNVLALDYSNTPAMYYDRWHLADIYDPNSEWIAGKYPATRRLDADNGANRLESDVQRVDATYLRLKSMELGYTIPEKLNLKKAGISRLRCYVNAFNVLVFCNKYLKSFDPEITDGNGFQYPLSRSYYFGVNVTF